MIDQPEEKHHEMILTFTHEDGSEEMYCPICGRSILIQWQPYKKTVISNGDIFASHSAYKGGLKMNLQMNDEHRLEDWKRMLSGIGLDSLLD